MGKVKLTIDGESGEVITLLNALQKFAEPGKVSIVEDPNYYRLSFDTTVRKKVELTFQSADLQKIRVIGVHG